MRIMTEKDEATVLQAIVKSIQRTNSYEFIFTTQEMYFNHS